jgi:hypothetical protein
MVIDAYIYKDMVQIYIMFSDLHTVRKNFHLTEATLPAEGDSRFPDIFRQVVPEFPAFWLKR